MATTIKIIAVSFLIACLNIPNALSATEKPELQLPELGDTSSATFSLDKEYEIGRAWLKSFRGHVRTVSDPLLQDYIEGLVYSLASVSELKDRRLDIVIVDNRSINAFAVPGGVIGVHNGLLLQAETEAQLSSVLSHELAHLSQRHFARGIEAQKNNSVANMAGLLAGIVLIATTGSDAGLAVISGVQAAGLQNQLRYSRLHEQEADRIGMQTMIRAEMDPNGAAGMFEKMQQATRYQKNRPPEFLLTHPVTESRISDARNRSRQAPRKMYTDSTQFQLMRARVELHFASNTKSIVQRFRTRMASENFTEADQYGLALALIANGELLEAKQRLATLRKASPQEISYIIAEAELHMAAEENRRAITLLNAALSINPGSHPITMTLAQALLDTSEPHRAAALLGQHSKLKPDNPSVWYLLAEAQGLAGDIVAVHRARAEFFVLRGRLQKAATQLGYALPLVKNNHLNTTIIEERIIQIRQMEIALKEL